MGIEQLLAAAKLLDEREANEKQGLRTQDKKSKRINKRSPSYRRAHLRDCLETLKEIVPTPPDHQKSTTLSLLQNARQYIKVLESSDKKAVETKRKLEQERYKMLQQLKHLRAELDVRLRKSSEGESCEDDVDIDDTEYHSESDDRCSMDSSGGSDGGL